MNNNPLSRRHLILGLGASLSALSGCASIPSGGSVNHFGDPQKSSQASNSEVVPSGPRPGATPQEILQGFFSAGVGAENDYEIARQYLTESMAASWKSEERVFIYQQGLSIKPASGQGTFTVAVPVQTQISDNGIARTLSSTEERKFNVKLTQVDGQWRIDEIPNGLVLERGEFNQSFAPFTLYFYDPTFTYAVPDIRWFARRLSVATSMVRVLLGGPAPYLKNAVRSAIPAQTELSRNSVPVETSEAQVSLKGPKISTDMPQLEIERIQSQLSQTLRGINGIDKVSLRFDDQNVHTGTLENYIEPQVNPAVAQNIISLEGTKLSLRSELLNDQNMTTVHEDPEGTITQTAMGYTRQHFAYLNADRSVMTVIGEKRSERTVSGTNLTRPSFDQFQWVWISNSDGTVRALSMGGAQSDAPRQVEVNWLDGAQITSLRLSRDGARVAVVTRTGKTTHLWVCGVERDDENKPVKLSDPVRVGVSIEVDYAAWISDEALIGANFSTGESEMCYLSGKTVPIAQLDSLTQVAACIGREQVLAQTESQNIYLLVDRAWTRVETSAHDLNYSS